MPIGEISDQGTKTMKNPARIILATLLVSLLLCVGSVFSQGNGEFAAMDQGTVSERALSLPSGSSLEGPIDPDRYILGPSDRLMVIVRGPRNSVLDILVLPEGNVLLPNIGSFRAAGLTLSSFKEKLRSELGRFYKNVEIDCQLSVPRKFLVYVLGEVLKPGPVSIRAPFRLSTALDGAGGIGEKGSLRRIEIREGKDVLRRIDLFAFLRRGDLEENPILDEGQTLFVPVRKMMAKIVGEVRKPGSYEVLPDETISDLIAFSGGFTARGDSERIVIERLEGDAVATSVLSYRECCEAKIKDQDFVVVPDVRSYPRGRFVQVVGGGGRNGFFYITRGEKLQDFLLRIGSFGEQYDLSRGVIERDLPGGKKEYIYIDLNRVLQGDESGNIELARGDVIAIPKIEDKVFVTGEVVEPGEFPYRPGLKAERYIGLAGGPTDNGSIDKLSIFSPVGKKRGGNRNSLIYRGETILVKRKTSKTLGAFFVSLTSLSGLLISIIAITR